MLSLVVVTVARFVCGVVAAVVVYMVAVVRCTINRDRAVTGIAGVTLPSCSVVAVYVVVVITVVVVIVVVTFVVGVHVAVGVYVYVADGRLCCCLPYLGCDSFYCYCCCCYLYTCCCRRACCRCCLHCYPCYSLYDCCTHVLYRCWYW